MVSPGYKHNLVVFIVGARRQFLVRDSPLCPIRRDCGVGQLVTAQAETEQVNGVRARPQVNSANRVPRSIKSETHAWPEAISIGRAMTRWAAE